MSALLGVYDRDLVIVVRQGRAAHRHRGQHLPGLRGRHRRERPRLRQPQGRGRHPQAGGPADPRQQPLPHRAGERAGRPPGRRSPSRRKVFFCNSGTEAVEAAIKFARRIGKRAGAHGARGLRGLLPRPHHGRPLDHLEGEVPRALRAARPRRALLPLERPQGGGRARDRRRRRRRCSSSPCRAKAACASAPTDFLHGLRRHLPRARARCSSPRRSSAASGARASCSPTSTRRSGPTCSPWPSRWAAACPWARCSCARSSRARSRVGDHGSTFGGNPVAAAAALVVLDRLTSDGFLAKVEKQGRVHAARACTRCSAATRTRSARSAASGSWSASSSRARRRRREGAARARHPRHQGRATTCCACCRRWWSSAARSGRSSPRSTTCWPRAWARPRKEAAVRLRDAEERDVAPLLALINGYADRGPAAAPHRGVAARARCPTSSWPTVPDGDGEEEIVGCGALTMLGPALGEVRSLAVRADQAGKGLGRAHRGAPAGRGPRAAASREVLALTRRVVLLRRARASRSRAASASSTS